MKWAYGVTTVPARRHDLLPQSLASLARAGFDRPRLFVDGDTPDRWEEPVTCRGTVIKPFGNWVLALGELYFREPFADRYAIFQDDILCVSHLREYLERWYPDRGYLNLYTFPFETKEIMRRGVGWHPSRQCGKGAAGLVFSRDAVLTLLAHPHMVDRPMDPFRGWKLIDGGLVESAKKAGWTEYIHHPSLLQHTGKTSTFDKRKESMGHNPNFPRYDWARTTFADPWMGEEYDARKF